MKANKRYISFLTNCKNITCFAVAAAWHTYLPFWHGIISKRLKETLTDVHKIAPLK